MPPVGFEPTISAGERPQTYALDRAATGTGLSRDTSFVKFIRAPGLFLQLFVSFLLNTESEYKYLLLYTEIG